MAFFCSALFITCAYAQPTTNADPSGPRCQGSNPRQWNNCVGTFTFPNGNTYTGEWQNGMRQGNGKIRIVAKGKSTSNSIASDAPSTYVGQFANDRINGHGVWTTFDGKQYEGNFVDNIMVSPISSKAPAQPVPQPEYRYSPPPQVTPSAPPTSPQKLQMCRNLEANIKENDPQQNKWLAFQINMDDMNCSAGNKCTQLGMRQSQILSNLTNQYMQNCQ